MPKSCLGVIQLKRPRGCESLASWQSERVLYVLALLLFATAGTSEVFAYPDSMFLAPVYPVRAGDGMAIGDLNGDQAPNIAVVDGSPSRLYVLLNQGDGTFGTAVMYFQVHNDPSAVLVFGAPSLGQNSSPARGVHGSIKTGVEDGREYSLHREGRKREGAGGLKYGGFCGNPASHISANYSASPKGEVTVQTMHHVAEYQYVIHDFYGAFLAMAEDVAKKTKMKGRATGEAPPHHLVEFVEWTSKLDGKSSVLVHLHDISQDTGRGNVGWFSEQNGHLTTVMIRYEDAVGLPRMVIDAHLAKVPSQVEPGTAELSQWIEKDIVKWIALLKSRGSERFVLKSAAWRLQRYAKQPFGKADPSIKMSDPDGPQRALADYIERVEKWAAERDQRGASGTAGE